MRGCRVHHRTVAASNRGNRWRIAWWLLSAAFVVAAALNLLHLRGGFLTNHLADLVVPAWLYVVSRGLAGHRGNPLTRWIGATAGRCAAVFFIASALTEVSQRWWPHGVFRGRFDPLDIVAYAVSLLACYVADVAEIRPSVTEPS